MPSLHNSELVPFIYLVCSLIAVVAVGAQIYGWSLCLGTARRRGLYFVWISAAVLACIITALVVLLLHR